MATLIVEAVPQSQTGVATGMNTIMRSIGGALGAQILASIVAAHADEAHFVAAFLVSAGGLVLAFLAAPVHPAPAGPRPRHRAARRPPPRRADGDGVQVMTMVSRLGSDSSRRRSPFGANPSAR